jgi:hypothetical protein
LPRAIDNSDLLVVDPQHPGKVEPFLQTPGPIFEAMGRFSPDGRWVAYQSNESKRNEVYVQFYPPSGGRWQISTTGGNSPIWRGDGREIFYTGPDDTLYAVSVETKSGSLEVGNPVKLFQRVLIHASPQTYRWAADRDGQRFLLNVPVGNAKTASGPGRSQLGRHAALGSVVEQASDPLHTTRSRRTDCAPPGPEFQASAREHSGLFRQTTCRTPSAAISRACSRPYRPATQADRRDRRRKLARHA